MCISTIFLLCCFQFFSFCGEYSEGITYTNGGSGSSILESGGVYYLLSNPTTTRSHLSKITSGLVLDWERDFEMQDGNYTEITGLYTTTGDYVYYVGNHIVQSSASYNPYMLSYEDNGNIDVKKRYIFGLEGNHRSISFHGRLTSRFFIVGHTQSSGYDSAFVMRLLDTGEVVWATHYNSTAGDLVKVGTGDITNSGDILVPIQIGNRISLFEVDENDGLIMGSVFTYDNINSPILYGAREISGGYIFFGSVDNLGLHGFIVKVDGGDGSITWEKRYTTLGFINDVDEMSDNSLLVTGNSNEALDANKQYIILKLDSSGNVEWTRRTNGQSKSLGGTGFNAIGLDNENDYLLFSGVVEDEIMMIKSPTDNPLHLQCFSYVDSLNAYDESFGGPFAEEISLYSIEDYIGANNILSDCADEDPGYDLGLSYYCKTCVDEHYYMPTCDVTTCHGPGKFSNMTETCNFEYGSCIGYDDCDCDLGYFGDECEFWNCSNILFSKSDEVCHNRGECVTPDTCICDPNVLDGNDCEDYECSGTSWMDDDVCFWRNGTCNTYDDFNRCDSCTPGYFGVECEIIKCGEFFSNDTSHVCTGHGTCIKPDTCACVTTDYTPTGLDSYCDEWNCYGFPHDSKSVCFGGNGTCDSHNNCTCNPGYSGPDCSLYYCRNVLYNISDEVCFSHGSCLKPDVCDCSVDYYNPGDFCYLYDCYGIRHNDSSVCSFMNGTCTAHDNCSCNYGYYGIECEIWECDGYLHNDTENVCHQHGRCMSPDNCVCFQFFYPGGDEGTCELWDCFGIPENSPEVCNFLNGTCVGPSNCSCTNEGYYGIACHTWDCFGEEKDDEMDVCTGWGLCSKPDECICQTNYTGEECERWECYGYLNNNTQVVCSGHGACTSHDECVCYSDVYDGIQCEEWTCFNKSVLETESVCSGFGNCISQDICQCKRGYSGEECEIFYCGELVSTEDNVCSSMGSCEETQECVCTNDFEGDNCETWSCYGLEQTTSGVCSGSGDCLNPDFCDCKGGFTGDYCQTNTLYGSVMAPILVIFGGAGICYLLICCCAFCCFACFIFIFLFFSICCSCLVRVKQSSGIKKFSQLRNFDLLLEEQESEKNHDYAKLKINNNMFQIPFDEIEVKELIGEGGSQSVVFKALWQRRVVAFKCFKTRNLCVDQNTFSEFEKEVEILGSLSHPNVIRFFGASLKPPRVGILMEYCENGELIDFLFKYKEKKKKPYPISGKIRLGYEIANSCDYLHSRGIIHRDLKCENVLVDGKECAKLMDFGLSRLNDDNLNKKTVRIGTNIYMAPEVVTTGMYSEKCDVFSFGILLWVMFCDNNQPYGVDDFNVEFKVANDPSFRPSLSELWEKMGRAYGPWLEKIINKCWTHDAKDRYTFPEVSKVFEKKIKKIKTEKSASSSRGGGGREVTQQTVFPSNIDDEDYNMDEGDEEEGEDEEDFDLYVEDRRRQDEVNRRRKLEEQRKKLKLGNLSGVVVTDSGLLNEVDELENKERELKSMIERKQDQNKTYREGIVKFRADYVKLKVLQDDEYQPPIVFAEDEKKIQVIAEKENRVVSEIIYGIKKDWKNEYYSSERRTVVESMEDRDYMEKKKKERARQSARVSPTEVQTGANKSDMMSRWKMMRKQKKSGDGDGDGGEGEK